METPEQVPQVRQMPASACVLLVVVSCGAAISKVFHAGWLRRVEGGICGIAADLGGMQGGEDSLQLGGRHGREREAERWRGREMEAGRGRAIESEGGGGRGREREGGEHTCTRTDSERETLLSVLTP